MESRFTSRKAANNYLNENGVRVGKELHLKEGVRTTGEIKTGEFYEKTGIVRCPITGQIRRVVTYRLPQTVN